MKKRLQLAAMLAIAAPATAQQELFLIDSANQIWRVDDFAAAAATLTPVVQVSPEAGFWVRDLAVDPNTGLFYVLNANASTARISAVDPASGSTATLCDVPATFVDGLDRRSDGVLAFQAQLTTLHLVDPVSCIDWAVTMSQSVAVHTSGTSLAFDERGILQTGAPDTSAFQVDPFTGVVVASNTFTGYGPQALEVDQNGDQYIGTFTWSLIRVDPVTQLFMQVPITNPPGGTVRLRGLAFTEPADGVGITHECDGAPNSTGRASQLEVLGVPIIGNYTLDLRVRDLPPSTFGIFVLGQNSGSIPVFAGTLCISAPVFRNNSTVHDSGMAGQTSLSISTSVLPVGIALLAGDSYVFQYWHRDGAAIANLSSAKRVTFR